MAEYRWTKLPNSYYDYAAKHLSNAAKDVFLVLWRRTVGFGKSAEVMTVSQIRLGQRTREGVLMYAGCGYSERTVYRGISQLEDLGFISRESRQGKPTTYRVLPVERWKIPLPETPARPLPDIETLDTDGRGPLTPVAVGADTDGRGPLTPVADSNRQFQKTTLQQTHKEGACAATTWRGCQSEDDEPEPAELSLTAENEQEAGRLRWVSVEYEHLAWMEIKQSGYVDTLREERGVPPGAMGSAEQLLAELRKRGLDLLRSQGISEETGWCWRVKLGGCPARASCEIWQECEWKSRFL